MSEARRDYTHHDQLLTQHLQRFFGDLDKGIDSFEAPWVVDVTEGDPSYDKTEHTRITLKECVQEYKQSDVHHLPDVGNDPSFVYILRDRDWQGEE